MPHFFSPFPDFSNTAPAIIPVLPILALQWITTCFPEQISLWRSLPIPKPCQFLEALYPELGMMHIQYHFLHIAYLLHLGRAVVATSLQANILFYRFQNKRSRRIHLQSTHQKQTLSSRTRHWLQFLYNGVISALLLSRFLVIEMIKLQSRHWPLDASTPPLIHPTIRPSVLAFHLNLKISVEF